MLETTSFYAPPECFRDRWVTLPEEEAHHAANVLRGAAGEEVIVVDGEGGWYRVRLETLDKNHVTGVVLEEQREVGEPSYELTIGIALLKNRRRFETFLEKAVELGVRRILPLDTERTEKQRLRMDRAERIMIAALKQTRRSRLPTLQPVQSLEEVLQTSATGISVICHEQADRSATLGHVLDGRLDAPIQVLIGPEGGFSGSEIEQARRKGWQLASLGCRRLRAETAGITVAAAVQLLNSSDV